MSKKVVGLVKRKLLHEELDKIPNIPQNPIA